MASPARSRRRATAQGENASVTTGPHLLAAAVISNTPSPGVQRNNSDPTPSSFPATFLEQWVQRVATAVAQQLQTTTSLPAVETPNVQQLRSPSSASLPTVETKTVQQLATEVAIVGESAACDQVRQEVHSVHSFVAGKGPSFPGRAQPKEVFRLIYLLMPVWRQS